MIHLEGKYATVKCTEEELLIWKALFLRCWLPPFIMREDTKGDFCGDIYVAGVCHEECFEGVICQEASVQWWSRTMLLLEKRPSEPESRTERTGRDQSRNIWDPGPFSKSGKGTECSIQHVPCDRSNTQNSTALIRISLETGSWNWRILNHLLIQVLL